MARNITTAQKRLAFPARYDRKDARTFVLFRVYGSPLGHCGRKRDGNASPIRVNAPTSLTKAEASEIRAMLHKHTGWPDERKAEIMRDIDRLVNAGKADDESEASSEAAE